MVSLEIHGGLKARDVSKGNQAQAKEARHSLSKAQSQQSNKSQQKVHYGCHFITAHHSHFLFKKRPNTSAGSQVAPDIGS